MRRIEQEHMYADDLRLDKKNLPDVIPDNNKNFMDAMYSTMISERRRADQLEMKSKNLELQTQVLENRIMELETFLKEYFIDTTYLDNLRRRKAVSSVLHNTED